MRFHFVVSVVVLSLALSACNSGGGGSSSPSPGPIVAPPPPPAGTVSVIKNVQISWAKNKEARANQVGGGYRVYISFNPNFNIGDAGVLPVIDVPSDASTAAQAMLNTTVPLNSGTYYIKIQAYYTLVSGETSSVLSDQTTINVPFDPAP